MDAVAVLPRPAEARPDDAPVDGARPATTRPATTRLLHLPALDGLRAIAVVAVVLYHLELTSGRAQGGYLGVDVFFVVSGYLITSLLLQEHRTQGRIDVPGFWGRRARRLLPAVIVAITVVCAWGALFARSDVASYRGDGLASLLYVQNWHAIFGDQPYFTSFGRPSPFRHLWSLSIEEQFYLLWPLVLVLGLFFLSRRWMLALTLGLAAGSAALMAATADVAALERAYYGTDTRAFGLLIGAALAFVWRPGRRFVDRRGKHAPWAIDAVALAALGALLWQFDGRSEYDPWTFPRGLLWVDLLAVVLVIASATVGSKVGRLLSIPVLLWIGRRSYSIYLWHWPVFAFTRPGVDIGLTGWPANVLRLGIALVLADLSYRFVEQPFRDGRAAAWFGAFRRPRQARQVGFAVAAAVLVLAVAGTTVAGTASATADGEEVASDLPLPPPPEPEFPPKEDDDETSGVTSTTGATSTTLPGTGATTSTTVPAPTTPPPAPTTTIVTEPVSIIGDSVTLGARTSLEQRFSSLQMDAVVARQVNDTVDVIAALSTMGALGSTVVVHMGNNGPIPEGALDRLLAAVGDRRLILVTVSVPRRWEAQVNDTLRAFVGQHPEVGLVDWFAEASADPGLKVGDGVHLSRAGIARYVDLLAYATR